MNLSTHNKLAMLYREFYNKEDLPTNLCSYFWLSLIAVICTPLIWPALLINKLLAPFKWVTRDWGSEIYPHYTRGYRHGIPTIIGLIINILLFLLGIVFTKLFYGNMLQFMSPFKWYINGLLGIGLGILVITLFLKLVTYLDNRNPKSKIQESIERELRHEKFRLKSIKYKQSFRYLVWCRIVAWKENNCPIILWDLKK